MFQRYGVLGLILLCLSLMAYAVEPDNSGDTPLCVMHPCFCNEDVEPDYTVGEDGCPICYCPHQEEKEDEKVEPCPSIACDCPQDTVLTQHFDENGCQTCNCVPVTEPTSEMAPTTKFTCPDDDCECTADEFKDYNLNDDGCPICSCKLLPLDEEATDSPMLNTEAPPTTTKFVCPDEGCECSAFEFKAYSVNDDGCPVCRCQPLPLNDEEETTDSPAVESSIAPTSATFSTEELFGCPSSTCDCEPGMLYRFYVDDNGCPLCLCEDVKPDSTTSTSFSTEALTTEPSEHICPAHECKHCEEGFSPAYSVDDDGCLVCHCFKDESGETTTAAPATDDKFVCPEHQCSCNFDEEKKFAVDSDGCPSCQCIPVDDVPFEEEEETTSSPTTQQPLTDKFHCPSYHCDCGSQQMLFTIDDDGCPACQCGEEEEEEMTASPDIPEDHSCGVFRPCDCAAGFHEQYSVNEMGCPICTCTIDHDRGTSGTALDCGAGDSIYLVTDGLTEDQRAAAIALLQNAKAVGLTTFVVTVGHDEANLNALRSQPNSVHVDTAALLPAKMGTLGYETCGLPFDGSTGQAAELNQGGATITSGHNTVSVGIAIGMMFGSGALVALLIFGTLYYKKSRDAKAELLYRRNMMQRRGTSLENISCNGSGANLLGSMEQPSPAGRPSLKNGMKFDSHVHGSNTNSRTNLLRSGSTVSMA